MAITTLPEPVVLGAGQTVPSLEALVKTPSLASEAVQALGVLTPAMYQPREAPAIQLPGAIQIPGQAPVGVIPQYTPTIAGQAPVATPTAEVPTLAPTPLAQQAAGVLGTALTTPPTLAPSAEQVRQTLLAQLQAGQFGLPPELMTQLQETGAASINLEAEKQRQAVKDFLTQMGVLESGRTVEEMGRIGTEQEIALRKQAAELGLTNVQFAEQQRQALLNQLMQIGGMEETGVARQEALAGEVAGRELGAQQTELERLTGVRETDLQRQMQANLQAQGLSAEAAARETALRTDVNLQTQRANLESALQAQGLSADAAAKQASLQVEAGMQVQRLATELGREPLQIAETFYKMGKDEQQAGIDRSMDLLATSIGTSQFVLDEALRLYGLEKNIALESAQLNAAARASRDSSIASLFAGIATLASCTCFNFLEAEGELKDCVRRYRDEFYSKNKSLVSKGYRLMGSLLVPLMGKYGWARLLMRLLMTKPAKRYTQWYYGGNKYGFIFYPLIIAWVTIWRIMGLFPTRLREYGWLDYYRYKKKGYF